MLTGQYDDYLATLTDSGSSAIPTSVYPPRYVYSRDYCDTCRTVTDHTSHSGETPICDVCRAAIPYSPYTDSRE